MAKQDPELRFHREWMGLLQPVGLVVSPPALVKAQAVPSSNVAELQQQLIAAVASPPTSALGGDDEPFIDDFLTFARKVLQWDLDDVAGAEGGPAMPYELELVLPDFHETLRPSLAVVDGMGDGAPLMLVQVLPRGAELDHSAPDDGPGWSVSPQVKLERLMREVKVPAGLLCNGDALRLVYAPSGESSGHLTFPVAAMCEVSGRPILGALHMLLCSARLVEAKDGRRLLDILADSRKYQAEVSNALSDQVLGALWELLRGFQAADPEDGQRIFDQTAREDPQHVYGGLLTLLMRLIFVLYAEDEELMPAGEVYANNYSVGGLYDRLRADAGRYPDTMDQRYGAYAWLLSTFRLIFDGGGHGGLRLPTRHGQLFNPDEYPFLEGRPYGVMRVMGDKFEAPRVSDGCVYRVLDALLVLEGERLSYRALDVEQVGSVYEAMMGYEVERALGRSIAVRPKHIVINVEDLLEVDAGKRKKWLKDQGDADLTGAALKALKNATSAEDIVAALGRRVSPRSLDAAGTPRLMAPDTLYLQPGEERRRTGSHYTPRELTEPIVRTTLRPVLEALGERPMPEQILDLRVCDPAMGSGAFLVEATRQLADHLANAWEIHDAMPKIPADEEPVLHARRLVAQRCIYGVDKNPFAVNLAKLSIWLVTLAKDHAFTFIDHSLKHGDSLVGLTEQQIAAFHWKTDAGSAMDLVEEKLKQDIEEALDWRDALQGLDEDDYNQKKEAWLGAELALDHARRIADVVLAAYFSHGHEKARPRGLTKDRERSRLQLLSLLAQGDTDAVEGHRGAFRHGDHPLDPFHWEVEFPEVFDAEDPGFDAIVGNPPFLGGTTIGGRLGIAYHDYLVDGFPPATGLADLVAFFLRRSFGLLSFNGSLGLIATNTVSQGDTRLTGLAALVEAGGVIYRAERRFQWPGQAAVVVSVVHVSKNPRTLPPPVLDGREVERISSFLLESANERAPEALAANRQLCYSGTKLWGAGFVFESKPSNGSSSLDEMRELIDANPENEDVIRPFLGGSEFNSSPSQSPSRFAIDFGDMSEERAQRWPDLFRIVDERVRPVRANNKQRNFREEWWKHANRVLETEAYSRAHERLLAVTVVAPHFSFGFADSTTIVANSMVLFLRWDYRAFAILQSRVHDVWARFIGSSMKDDPRYTTACFMTFPLPDAWQTDSTAEGVGGSYYAYRAEIMVRNDEGLTKTYNRLHDPNNHEPDIAKLRKLHAAMDRAVLDAYGWKDIPTDSEFLLDHDIDEETWGTKKKPYRYRWPDAVHDDVLARLLDLNQTRYEKEVAAGLHDRKGKKKSTPGKAKAATDTAGASNLGLFDALSGQGGA